MRILGRVCVLGCEQDKVWWVEMSSSDGHWRRENCKVWDLWAVHECQEPGPFNHQTELVIFSSGSERTLAPLSTTLLPINVLYLPHMVHRWTAWLAGWLVVYTERPSARPTMFVNGWTFVGMCGKRLGLVGLRWWACSMYMQKNVRW